ncbi:hypothetical protein KAT92_05240 [Candidatus Babeliales bacterium]|nr:hypothetical protein [Candidatus Babeliales bacterium]
MKNNLQIHEIFYGMKFDDGHKVYTVLQVSDPAGDGRDKIVCIDTQGRTRVFRVAQINGFVFLSVRTEPVQLGYAGLKPKDIDAYPSYLAPYFGTDKHNGHILGGGMGELSFQKESDYLVQAPPKKEITRDGYKYTLKL